MSYKERAKAEGADVPPVSTNCPAYGCPNAASTSLDGARWACYHHARATADKWPAVTEFVLAGWPATGNWDAPQKAAYEAEQSAKRRAALPQRRAYASDAISVADAFDFCVKS